MFQRTLPDEPEILNVSGTPQLQLSTCATITKDMVSNMRVVGQAANKFILLYLDAQLYVGAAHWCHVLDGSMDKSVGMLTRQPQLRVGSACSRRASAPRGPPEDSGHCRIPRAREHPRNGA